jgi:hypothetical protein
MSDDKTASEGPTVGFDQRRRYPAPTIDLTATVVADGQSHAAKEPEAPGSTFATDQSAYPDEQSNVDDRAAMDNGNDGRGNGSSNGSRWRGWKSPHWRLVGAGAAGGAIMLLSVLALQLLGFPPREQSLVTMTDRLSRIETRLENLSSRAGTGGDAALADRLGAVESTLKALETDNANLNGRVSETADAARSARARAETAAKAAAQASDNPQGLIGQSDLDALSSRLATLEKTTKAIQTELEKRTNGADDQAARIALLATSVRLAVERGNGFAEELGDLKSVIKDPRELALLEPFAASGVPTPAVLQRDLSALTPVLLKAANVSTSEGGFISRLQANAERLVRVRPLDETPGDEPENVVMRIELKSARGDIPGALAEFAKLPAAAREPAEEWIKKAESREAAIAQARKISTDALGALVTGR